MDIFGHWTEPLPAPLQPSPAIVALSPEFISAVAVLYSLLSPQDTAFEVWVDAQLTALEAPIPLKAVFLAKRALLGVVKQALWAKIDPNLAQIAYKVDTMEAELFAELVELMQEETLQCFSRGKEGEKSLSGEIQSFGVEFAESAAHLSAKVASEVQLLERYRSFLTSNPAVEDQIKSEKPILSRPKASSDADISLFAGNPALCRHFQRKSLPFSSESRPMTLRQLLTFLSEVYAFKDSRSSELGLQVESLREHLERYLDVKYGLKVVGK